MATDPSTAVERDAPACPLQALLEAIQAVDASRPDLTTAEELEALEHTLGEFTDRLRGLLLKLQVQRALDGEVLRTERDYLIGHRERMAYGKVADAGPPLGGDAMESAVRRVVNLRLKGPGIFRRPESAEGVLMLRSFYKAGRWNALKRLALAPTAALIA